MAHNSFINKKLMQPFIFFMYLSFLMCFLCSYKLKSSPGFNFSLKDSRMFSKEILKMINFNFMFVWGYINFTFIFEEEFCWTELLLTFLFCTLMVPFCCRSDFCSYHIRGFVCDELLFTPFKIPFFLLDI